ncbi:MAG: substrate-binding domain-containing protein [Polyangiales bacterium]
MIARRVLLASLLAVSLLGGCKKSGGTSGTMKIAVIPKGTTHEFWKAVHAGAAKAGKELGVEIAWNGPLKEDDLKGQIDIVQSFTSQGVSGIVLAPLNDKALQKSVHDAVGSKVPVVIFDSDLQGSDHSSFVATDNVVAGKLAGEAMAKALGDKGNVVVLRYQVGSASTSNREDGFLQAIKAHPGVTVVSENQYGGATTETANAKSESLLAAQKAGDGQVQGVFCPNESTTFGMLLALRKAGLAGKVTFIGFDSSDKLIEGMQSGDIQALVLQNPYMMGYRAVGAMVDVIRGKATEKRIDTGVMLLTKENMGEPAMKALLHPDLGE